MYDVTRTVSAHALLLNLSTVLDTIMISVPVFDIVGSGVSIFGVSLTVLGIGAIIELMLDSNTATDVLVLTLDFNVLVDMDKIIDGSLDSI